MLPQHKEMLEKMIAAGISDTAISRFEDLAASTRKQRLEVLLVVGNQINACDYYRAYMVGKYLDRHEVAGVRLVTNVSSVELYTADLVVVFRAKDPSLMQMLEHAKVLGANLLIDYDDNIFSVPASNYLMGNFNDRDKQVAMELLRRTDQLTVTTPQLGALLSQQTPNYCVIPNVLDWDAHDRLLDICPKQEKEYFRVAWAGTQTHTEDLMGHGWGFLNAVMELLDKHQDVQLVMFGMCPQELLDRYMGRIQFHHPVDLFQYMPTLASFDLDLMCYPLQANQFNYCKSNIRWLECSSIKVPVLASKIPSFESVGEEYCRTISHEEGAWTDALEEAYQERTAMKAMAERSYDRVKEAWTMDALWPAWAMIYLAAASGNHIPGDYTPSLPLDADVDVNQF